MWIASPSTALAAVLLNSQLLQSTSTTVVTSHASHNDSIKTRKEVGTLPMCCKVAGLLLAFLFADLAYSELTLAQDKLPIPSADAQQQALTLIKEVYGQEWEAAKTPDQKSALSQKLLDKSREATDDATRFALIRVGRALAIQGGDVSIAFQAIEVTSYRFQIDTFAAKVRTLLETAKSASTPAHQKAVATEGRKLIEEAVEEDDFETVKRLYEAAVANARSAHEWDLAREIVARNREIEEMAAAYAAIDDAVTLLKIDPVDPEANLAVGKYHCFIKGNWSRGLPMLALGNDEKLKELSVKELREVSDTDGQVALGDGWWDVAATSEGVAQKQIQERAALWYRRALPGLSGLVRDRVEKRLKTAVGKTNAEPPSTYLATLAPLVVNVGEGVSGFRAPFYLGGEKRVNGFKAHPKSHSTSIIVFNLNKAYRKLTGAAGISDVVTSDGKRIRQTETALIFEIRGDQRSLWRSRPLQATGSSQDFSVDISGVKRLELCVHCPGKDGYAWARWVDPLLSK